MGFVFAILAILASILLVLLVVVQNSKGGGLSGALGASNITNVIGSRRATQDIEKFTWYLLAAVLIFAFMANVTTSGTVSSSKDSFESLLNAPNAVQTAPPVEASGAEAPAEE